MIVNPTATPKKCGMVRKNPKFAPDASSMKFVGSGVIEESIAETQKATIISGVMIRPHLPTVSYCLTSHAGRDRGLGFRWLTRCRRQAIGLQGAFSASWPACDESHPRRRGRCSGAPRDPHAVARARAARRRAAAQ